MGLFEGNKAKQIEYLEEERKKLWGRLIALEKEVQRKASDFEKEAAQSSKKAAEFKNKTEARFDEATQKVSQINTELESAKKLSQEISSVRSDIDSQKVAADEIAIRLEESETEYASKLKEVESRITTIDTFFEDYPDLDAELDKVNGYIESITENLDKSTVSLTALNKRKKDFDDLHREIFGYTQIDSDGETTTVEGLKDDLVNTYEKLVDDMDNAESKIEKINTEFSEKYIEFEKEHKKSYLSITTEIKNLLPNALTAGLSAAFSSKKADEVTASIDLQKRFTQGIYFLIGVSLLPLCISAYFLYQGISLEEAINRLPRLVLAIVPMYIPVLWFTYSANKKLNLSKRLIEEYAHKEVLSKTYEGLATQIEAIDDKSQSDELKFRLLANFLQVSSENPGKLISNYEASDHPIMEALEQSYKFQIAIDRLEGIPGLGKVAAILESKAKRKLDTRKAKIDNALTVDEDASA